MNNIEIIKMLLKKKYEILKEHKDIDYNFCINGTPLILYLVERDKLDSFKWLLINNLVNTIINKKGIFEIIIDKYKNKNKFLNFLIARKITLTTLNENNEPPLFKIDQLHFNIIKKILSKLKKSEINYINCYGQNVLIRFIKNNKNKKNELKIVSLLLKYGIDINHFDNIAASAIYSAIFENKNDIILELLNWSTFDISKHQKILNYLSKMLNYEILEIILKDKKFQNLVNIKVDEKTPLLFMTSLNPKLYDNVEMSCKTINTLIKFGADPKIKNERGHTCLYNICTDVGLKPYIISKIKLIKLFDLSDVFEDCGGITPCIMFYKNTYPKTKTEIEHIKDVTNYFCQYDKSFLEYKINNIKIKEIIDNYKLPESNLHCGDLLSILLCPRKFR